MIAIVGGGASGALTAAQIGLQATVPCKVVLFDPADHLAQGLAYGTRDLTHLLNVPAGKISALPDQPAHFLDWLNRPGNVVSLIHETRFEAGDFAPRAVYGCYLASLVEEVYSHPDCQPRWTCAPPARLDFIPMAQGGTIVTSDGDTEDVAHVVLSLGNLPPRDPLPGRHPFFRSARYVPLVWKRGAMETTPDEDVLLVGTGLTAVDVILALEAAGHRGKYYVTSRGGGGRNRTRLANRIAIFLAAMSCPARFARPCAWCAAKSPPPRERATVGVPSSMPCGRTPRHCGRTFRSTNAADFCATRGHFGNRTGIACHPVLARPGTARRRTPSGAWCPGDCAILSRTNRRHRAASSQRRNDLRDLHVQKVFIASGRESNFRQHFNDPLLINLLARGVLHPDPLFLGLEATETFEPIGAKGRPTNRSRLSARRFVACSGKRRRFRRFACRRRRSRGTRCAITCIPPGKYRDARRLEIHAHVKAKDVRVLDRSGAIRADDILPERLHVGELRELDAIVKLRRPLRRSDESMCRICSASIL